MKKRQIAAYFIFAVMLVTSVFCSINVISKDKVYMTKEQAEAEYSRTFYNDVITILADAGKRAEFYDKYRKDDKIIKDTEYTVGDLKKMYDEDNGVLYEYENKAFGIYYEDIPDNLIDEETAEDEYLYTSYDEYKKDLAKYNAMYNFFCDYNLINNDSLDGIYVNTNLSYLLTYTNQDGEKVEYYCNSPENSKSIFTGQGDHTKSFIYDQGKGAFIEGLSKELIYYDELVSRCDTFDDYTDFHLEVGVNTKYVHSDNYSYYAKEVITDGKMFVNYVACVAIAVGTAIIAFLTLIVLAIMTGQSKNSKDNKIYLIDKVWWDVTTIIGLIAIPMATAVLDRIANRLGIINTYKTMSWNLLGIYLLIICAVFVTYLLSIVRRVKCKCFWQTSMTGTIVLKVKPLVQKMFANMDITKKVIVITVLSGFFILSDSMLFYTALNHGDIIFLIWFFYTLGTISAIAYYVWKFLYEYNSIIESTKRIADGEIEYKLEEESKFKSNRDMVYNVNNIGMGLNKAVEESVKNERMKSDLITNVSHDIKTPLTSIINYVDLLKKENIDNESVKNYVNILEEKSHRLKVLTDDLVEASKLSSGAIKLSFEKMNIVEFLRQSAGEYEEKFAAKDLSVIMNLPEDAAYINGDGRKMWRVIENLYGNIYKYALRGTRVYVDLKTTESNIVISVKNISQNPLNFNSDELTERFIRGDVSRSTEGSGLGLSIAKSIVDSHNGQFDIKLDGDLFKVVITLEKIK